MARWRVWLLPALLAVAQLAYWPGPVIGRADPVRVAVAAAIVAVVTAGLVPRRRRPVVALAVVAGALGAGRWALPEQEYLVPGDALLVLGAADLIALFGVAVRCSRRTTALAVAGLVAWEAVWSLGDEPLDVPVALGVYAVVAAAGRLRRRWHADRSAAAHRLAEAEQARRDAAAAEQRRLARELHDVTAHHLTSIVVNASAASYLDRPDLRAAALDFAARTGRETLTALHELVAVLPAAPAPPSLADLADDFRQLGQVVRLEADGDPPPAPVLEAMHGIAREALTNTLRYAPGATVRLRLAYGKPGWTLIVEDDGGATGATGATGLGGGRGLAGMRDRAAALGGTVRSGPRPEGGWRVHAELPGTTAPPRLRVWLHSRAVLDAGLTAATLVVPLTGLTVLPGADGVPPAAVTLVLFALLAHSGPLLWRRRFPLAVLAVVALTAWLGPLLAATEVIPADGGWLFLGAAGADLAAVYAVAAHSPRPVLRWLAPIGSLGSAALALAVLMVLQPPVDDAPQPGTAGLLLVLTVLVGLPLTALFGASWLAGWAARRRRQRRLDREEGAVAFVAAQAHRRALDERARIAAGLRAAVLEHAAGVPRAAARDDLDGVLESARAALAAMRGLLDSLDLRSEEASSSASG